MNAKELGKTLFDECWGKGNLDLLDQILDAKHLFHLAEGDVEDIMAYKETIGPYLNALHPRFEIQHVIGEEAYAAIHYTETGRFSDDWITPNGIIKATGLEYSTFGVELIRVEAGKIVEAWPGHESATHYTQIGLAKWV